LAIIYVGTYVEVLIKTTTDLSQDSCFSDQALNLGLLHMEQVCYSLNHNTYCVLFNNFTR